MKFSKIFGIIGVIYGFLGRMIAISFAMSSFYWGSLFEVMFKIFYPIMIVERRMIDSLRFLELISSDSGQEFLILRYVVPVFDIIFWASAGVLLGFIIDKIMEVKK